MKNKYQNNSIEDAFTMVENGVLAVYSSENYLNYLKTLSKFHNYSFSNTMLIYAQKPDASLVAGYDSWKKNFKRQVRRGEKSIKILAPYKRKIKEEVYDHDESGHIKKDAHGNLLMKEIEVEKTFFKMVSVFDISQTDGEPLPQLVHELEGSSDNAKALIESVKEISQTPVYYRSVEEDVDLASGAKGYFNFKDDFIVIKEDMNEHQEVKTLVHEYCHSLYHRLKDGNVDEKEIEAESLAFVICDHFGIDTSDYSFSYIATYADKDQKFLRDILTSIRSKAHSIIDELTPVFERNLKQIVNSKEIDLNDASLTEKRDFTIYQKEYIAEAFISELHDKILGTGIHDYLRDSCCDEHTGMSELAIELDAIAPQIANQFPLAYELYKTDSEFKNNVNETVFLKSYYHIFDPLIDRPFLDNSIERHQYLNLTREASSIINGESDMLVFTDDSSIMTIRRETGETVSISLHDINDIQAKNDTVITTIFNNDDGILCPIEHERNTVSPDVLQKTCNEIFDDKNFLEYQLRDIKGKDINISFNENNKIINSQLLNDCEKHFIKKYLPGYEQNNKSYR